MADVFEFDMGDIDSLDKEHLGMLYSDIIYITLMLKGYGYDDEDVYTILSLLLNLNISSENLGHTRLDSIIERIRGMTESGEADEFIEILKMILKKD